MKHLITLCCLVFFTVGVVSAQTDYTPEFEPTECFEGVQADECGYLVVPQNRDEPDSGEIRIAVAINRGSDPDLEPVIFLAGGPGEFGLIYAQLAPLFPNRDYIAFDQRGVNMSTPRLDCPEYLDFINTFDGEMEELAQASFDLLVDCADTLRDAGVDMAAYSTSASAADVNDLVTALGYEQVNLIGISYGTRLGQEIIRDYPEIVRSAVFDSVIPPELDRPVETPRAVNDALMRIFAACEANADCNAAYPDLHTAFLEAVEALDANPQMVEFAGEETELNGTVFISIVFASMYGQPGVSEIPNIITNAADGDYGPLLTGFGAQVAQALATSIDFGMFFATECSSEVPYSDPEAQAAMYEELPFWEPVFGTSAGISAPFIYDLCAAMGISDADGDDNDPVESDVPVLFTAGEFDPVTPPSWLEMAADGFPNGYAYEIPAYAHGALVSGLCGIRVMSSFLEDPSTEPNTACFDTLRLNFVLPED